MDQARKFLYFGRDSKESNEKRETLSQGISPKICEKFKNSHILLRQTRTSTEFKEEKKSKLVGYL